MEERQKIVILEDDEMFAALLGETLGAEYDVATGQNGLHGIALCLEGGVSAVVTDLDMPDFDGVQMLREFRKNKRLAEIPVLVVTAADFTLHNRSDVESFPQVRGIFSKNESPETIAQALRAALGGG